MTDATTHELHREMKAAQAIKAAVLAMTDDEDAIRDTLEGETNLHELVRRVLLSIDDDQLIVDGCKARIEDLAARKSRVASRIEAKRTMIEQAMAIAELKTIETDVATATLGKRPRSVVVTNEAEIPAAYWKQQDPTLDKKALADALKNNEAIPGAELSNGGSTLTIRRR